MFPPLQQQLWRTKENRYINTVSQKRLQKSSLLQPLGCPQGIPKFQNLWDYTGEWAAREESTDWQIYLNVPKHMYDKFQIISMEQSSLTDSHKGLLRAHCAGPCGRQRSSRRRLCFPCGANSRKGNTCASTHTHPQHTHHTEYSWDSGRQIPQRTRGLI